MTVPVTNTAVDEAVDRLVVLVKAAAATLSPPIDRVAKAVAEEWAAPYIWIYPGSADFTWDSNEYSSQVYVATIRIVLGTSDSRYNRVLDALLWTAVPTIANYLLSRRHLITVQGQSPVKGLKTDEIVIGPASPFGDFDGSTETGIELTVTLPFPRITVKTVYPSV
jgi:hypothetical protein